MRQLLLSPMHEGVISKEHDWEDPSIQLRNWSAASSSEDTKDNRKPRPDTKTPITEPEVSMSADFQQSIQSMQQSPAHDRGGAAVTEPAGLVHISPLVPRPPFSPSQLRFSTAGLQSAIDAQTAIGKPIRANGSLHDAPATIADVVIGQLLQEGTPSGLQQVSLQCAVVARG